MCSFYRAECPSFLYKTNSNKTPSFLLALRSVKKCVCKTEQGSKSESIQMKVILQCVWNARVEVSTTNKVELRTLYAVIC